MAGTNVGTAYLEVVPSAKGIQGKIQAEIGTGMAAAGDSAGNAAAKGFGTRFKSGLKTAAIAGAAVLAGAAALSIGFLKDSIGEARESQKVGAITASIIKSTGGVAKVTADQVGDLATAISNKTGVDDEAIQAGANMLLTFKNVRNEVGKGSNVFDRATQAAADLSAAGFGDMAGQSKMLGKALNDPIKGISALSRSGVTFTKQQQDQIKTLVASGKTLEAQKIILGEVESQVGGTAEASATAGEKLATAWGNFKEGIGTSLLPTVDKLATFLKDRLLPGAQGVIDLLFKGDFTSGLSKAFHIEEDSKAVDFLFNLREGFKKTVAAAKDFVAGLTLKDAGDIGAPLEGFVATGQRVRVVILDLWDSAKKLWPSIKEIGTQLLEASKGAGVSTWGLLKAALGALPGILDAIAPVLESVAKWMGENKDVVAALVVALTAGATTFKVISGAVKAYTAVQALLNVVMTANPIGLVVVALAALAAGLIYAYKNSETFRKIIDGAFKAIGAVARWLWNSVFAPVIRFILEGFAKLVGGIGDFLIALGNIPGFGWAKTAGENMKGAAEKAHSLAEGIKDIPDTKNINVYYKEHIERVKLSNQERLSRSDKAFENRATGGYVAAGQPYIVGERRAEVFVPESNGRIMPRVNGAGGGGGGSLSESDIQRLAAAMRGIHVSATVSAGSFDAAMGTKR